MLKLSLNDLSKLSCFVVDCVVHICDFKYRSRGGPSMAIASNIHEYSKCHCLACLETQPKTDCIHNSSFLAHLSASTLSLNTMPRVRPSVARRGTVQSEGDQLFRWSRAQCLRGNRPWSDMSTPISPTKNHSAYSVKQCSLEHIYLKGTRLADNIK